MISSQESPQLEVETQHPPPPSPSAYTSPSHQPQLTRVNGIGMWNSWTRNFNTPLLALLDLIDNSFDAAMKPQQQMPSAAVTSPVASSGSGVSGASAPGSNAATTPLDNAATGYYEENYRGKIVIEADMFGPAVAASSSEATPPSAQITGLCITNNSFKPIKPLKRILEAYSSAKGRNEHGEGHFAETIGENGVGLKQGCAVLSDLSFVFVRNGKQLSLGVIAAKLQKEEGICLPSFELKSEDATGVRSEIMDIFGNKYRDTIGECVKEYGDGLLSVGVDRLVNHFGDMIVPEQGWGEEKFIFRLVLHNLLKDDTLASTRAKELMAQLYNELEHHYIHVPLDLEVTCDGRSIDFCYWQRRLVEMTVFTQPIDPNTPVALQKDDWKFPRGPGTYKIRIFIGFDPTREYGARSARLVIYSRHSGRLVLQEEDCRATLGLSAGSTEYSQGLTIVVDDMFGHLPLNPTKQDIAWCEQANGRVHKQNLYSWIGAIASLFYNMHLSRRYNNSKRALTAGVARHDHLPADACVVNTLDRSDFTQYENVTWKYFKATGNIRCANLKAVKQISGDDTHWCLEDVVSTPITTSRKKKRSVAEVSVDAAETADKYVENSLAPVHDLMDPGLSLQTALQVGFSKSPLRTPPRAAAQSKPTSATTQSELSERSKVQVKRGPDYKALYEEEKMQHEKLRIKYEKRRDHKALAKRLQEENQQLIEKFRNKAKESTKLTKALELERRLRAEDRKEREEQEATIARLKRSNALLEARLALTTTQEASQQCTIGGAMQCDL